MNIDIEFLKSQGYYNSKHYSAEAIDILRKIASGELVPLLSSVEPFNDLCRGFLPTDLVTVAGRSGAGKTTWLISFIKAAFDTEINPTYENKIALFYDSWEISGWRNMIKFASNVERKTVNELLDYKQTLEKETIDRIESTLNSLKFGNNLFISEMSTTPADWLKRKENISKKLQGYQIVNLVDHLRLVTKTTYSTEEALITDMMKASVTDKKKHKSINIFLSQMNRNIETNAKSRKDIGLNLPVASDIFGADSIFQNSDTLIALHRPGSYGHSEFPIGTGENGRPINIQTGVDEYGLNDNLLIQCILKNRFGEIGNVFCKHELKYNNITKFENIKSIMIENKIEL